MNKKRPAVLAFGILLVIVSIIGTLLTKGFASYSTSDIPSTEILIITASTPSN